MKLYQFKEFLTLDDVADYLRDKGVYDFDLSSSYDQNKLTDLLASMVREKKLTPIVYFNSLTMVQTYCFDTNETRKQIDLKEQYISGYFGIDFYAYLQISKNGLISTDYLDCDDEFGVQTYRIASNIGTGGEYRAIDYKPYKLEDFSYQTPLNHITTYQPNADDITVIYLHEIIYPKSELDALFNAKDDSQQQIADLQAENARLQARIAELESELNQQANAAPAIKHTNTALQALHDTIATHWQDYDPSQPRTRPKQEFITAWILENYPEIEPSKALWIDRIIRHGTHN